MSLETPLKHMGNTEAIAIASTVGHSLIGTDSSPLPSLPPLPPLPPPPTPKTGSFPDISVLALLIDAQDKLERHRQQHWLQLDKFQNARSEYLTSLQTTLKDVEEQAKRRNRVQLASFLRQEARSRELGYGLVEEVLAGLESRWQKAHDALAASLGNVLLEARHEEQEWNEMFRRLAAEEQARLADELPVMLRAASEAWKTEDQAEETWRTAWETTNLTLERLSQRVQQHVQQPRSSSQPRRNGSLTSNSSANGNEAEAENQVAIHNERRKSVVKTRRMTETRRQIAASTASISTSASASTSSSTSTSNVSVSVSVEESESQSFDELVVNPDRSEERHYSRSQSRSHEYQYHQHLNLQQQRQYLYSPIKNQMPGRELFDESLERISPDPKLMSLSAGPKPGLSMEENSTVTGVQLESATTSASTSVSDPTHLYPESHPASLRAKNSNGKIRVDTNISVNPVEEHNITPTTTVQSSKGEETTSTKLAASSTRSPKSQSQAQTQPQSQPQLHRKSSIKRATSNTSLKAASVPTSSPSKPRATSAGKRTFTLPPPTSVTPLSSSSSSSPSPSTLTLKDTTEHAKPSSPNKKAKSERSKSKGRGATTEITFSIDTVDNKRPRERNNSDTSMGTTPTQTPISLSSSVSWADYETRWRTLKSSSPLTFSSIPWPVAASMSISDIDGIDPQLVAEFILLSDQHQSQSQFPNATIAGIGLNSGSGGSSGSINSKKRIRAALLRWHPDRFNATILKNVVKSDKKAVQDGVGKVVRILNDMLAKEGGGAAVVNGNGIGG